MSNTQDPARPPLRDIIRAFDLGAKRRFGQHFLFDSNLTRKIVRAAGDLDKSSVIEIGPGPGGLTRALLDAHAKRVVAIELDPRCIAALGGLVAESQGRLTIIEGDALAISLEKVAPSPRRIVANLPYNIATPLLLQWLAAAEHFEEMVLMFQKEVADRLCAKPGSKAYGRLSIVAQWRMDITPLFDIGPKAFVPPPKIASTVLRLRTRAEPIAAAEGAIDIATLGRVTKAAFGQRRKMLRTSLKTLGVEISTLLEETGVSPTARAEELRVEDFCALARALAKRAA